MNSSQRLLYSSLGSIENHARDIFLSILSTYKGIIKVNFDTSLADKEIKFGFMFFPDTLVVDTTNDIPILDSTSLVVEDSLTGIPVCVVAFMITSIEYNGTVVNGLSLNPFEGFKTLSLSAGFTSNVDVLTWFMEMTEEMTTKFLIGKENPLAIQH